MGGWDSNVHVCDHTSSCLEIFSCTWSHTWVHALRSCLALDHTLDACFEFLPCTWLYTLCYGGDLLMHLTTHLMLCVEIFSCTGSHAWFYALRSTFALDHTLDATLWDFACSRWIFWNFFFPAAMKKSRFATPKPARSKSRPTVTANSQHVWSPPAKISAFCCGFVVAPTASGDCESASPRGVWKTTLPSFRVGKMNIQQKFLTLSDLNVIKQLYPEVLGKHR